MKHLPSSQMEIMLIIWDSKEPLTRKEIHRFLIAKNWQITTVNTLLNRLVKSEFLEVQHRLKEYVYTPLIDKDTYLAFEGKSMLKFLYGNSMKNFVATICDSDGMDKNEIVDLQKYLQELKDGKCDD